MLEPEVREYKSSERKDNKAIEGRRINAQQSCHQNVPKHRPKQEMLHKESPQLDTFRTILSKRDRHKESQSKLEHRPLRRNIQQTKDDRQQGKKENSKSRSKSKGLNKSKSMKHMVKKSKSMARLELRQERKSESPPFHTKSITSHGGGKQCKSHYNSKTTREMASELTTDRQKNKAKQTKSKKPKSQISKKSTSKLPIRKLEKQNLKQDSKFKKKAKKVKRVLISQEHSKIRREYEQWQLSLNEDEFLDPRHKAKSKSKLSNIVELPRRKERLSLNANHPRKPSLKNKTQVQHQAYGYHKQEIEYHAATTIQRIFRGYITRKYIQECFQHNAAIKIQKVWRGFKAWQEYQTLKSSASINASPYKNKPRVFEHQEYLLQKSSEAKSSNNEKWTSILEEILSEQNVSLNMKKKIEVFLQSQHQSLDEFNPLQQLKSPSARSSLSSQVIHNEIASERHFIQQQRLKKDKPVVNNLFLSPKQYMSPQQNQFCSPQHKLTRSPARSSTQLLVSNLKNIQRAHRIRLQSKATTQKEELNKMLIRQTLSPRTHEKMYKEVEMMLESQLEKFNESINEIVKNCMVYGQDTDNVVEADQSMTTPKKQLKQLRPPDFSPTHQPQPNQSAEISLELKEYYQVQRQMSIQKAPQFQPFDTSYQFIEQYLISLIDFVRQFEGGKCVNRVLASIHKPRSHEMDAIFRNSRPVTENSYDQDHENSFRLPMYKYIDLDEPILDDRLVDSFNKVFQKIHDKQLSLFSSLQEHFFKMVTESMNQALNALRPQAFPFSECKLATINTLKGLQNIPFQCQSSEQEMQYQYICAQALNKIFYWNRLEWGKIIRYSQSQQNYPETFSMLHRQMENSIIQLHSQDDWHFYEELIEIIGEMTEEIFETVVFEEIAAVWDVLLNWNHKIGRQMQIQAPDNRGYFRQ